MIRVIVADDQRVVRDGIAAMLGLFDGIEVVGVAASGEELVTLASTHAPDVALTDLRMPGIGGVEAIRQLAASGIAAVALTTYDDDTTIVQAMAAGALGFLTKDADPDQIEATVRAAAEGRALVGPAVLGALTRTPVPASTSESTGEPPTLPDGITPREADVLRLIAGGASNQQICRELFVSMATVKTHVNHLLSKSGAADRAALVSYAYRHRSAVRF